MVSGKSVLMQIGSKAVKCRVGKNATLYSLRSVYVKTF